jgi:hypothetical protein
MPLQPHKYRVIFACLNQELTISAFLCTVLLLFFHSQLRMNSALENPLALM